MKLSNMFCFSIAAALLLGMLTGCQQTQPTAPSEPTKVEVVQTQPADLLATWLAEAQPPKTVACSVSRDVAPEAVDRFTAIAEKVATVYSTVYNEAQEAATMQTSQNVMGDAVLAKVAESLTTQPTTEWKAAAQEAVIANYQATLKTIEEQRKNLREYTASLKTDGSISNLTSQLEKTAVLVKIGKDTAELAQQLKEAGEGASAVRYRRISTALGK